MYTHDFGLHGDLQDAGHELAPEVQQQAGGGVVRLAVALIVIYIDVYARLWTAR